MEIIEVSIYKIDFTISQFYMKANNFYPSLLPCSAIIIVIICTFPDAFMMLYSASNNIKLSLQYELPICCENTIFWKYFSFAERN